MADLPDNVKKQIMEDKKVQAAVQEQAAKMGGDVVGALRSPEVQRQILDTCKQTFPQYAVVLKEKIMDFAGDPEVQKQAKKYAAIAGNYVLGAGGALVAQIQQGPKGVRFLGFIGGVASVVISVMGLLSPFAAFFHPVKFVLSAYQLVFAATTSLFEAPPEYIQKVSGLDRYQDMLMDKAKFLAETFGRGTFYIFQGSLWLSLAHLADPWELAVGAWLVFVGTLNLLVHFGQLTVFADKLQEGYKRISREPAPGSPA